MEAAHQSGLSVLGSSRALQAAPASPESSEPLPKKRCLRFSSDLSAEDPSLVSDSGFGDLGPGIEHGDEEAATFFGMDLSDLPEGELELLVDEDKNPESGLTNSSILSGTSSEPSDPCCSVGSGSNSRSSSSASGSGNQSSSSTSSDDNSSWEDIFLQSKDIASSPSRIVMMEKFLLHLRNNPDDSQLQSFFQLLLAGPEFSPPRQRLRHVTHMSDVMRLFRCSKRILVLTGAGISVSCGIPDFRSKDGLYARVSKVFPHLPDPQSVFDIRLFKRDPRPFFLTAKELYPGQFEPSLAHKFIRKLESRGQLLRNYSQNIDTLETISGIEKVTMCHGSFATASCIRCKHRVDAEAIREKALKGEVPFCPKCSTPEETSKIKFPIGQSPPSQPAPIGPSRRVAFDDDDEEPVPVVPGPLPIPPVMKPDIVFFGEDLPDEFHNNLELDKPECDLLLVIGSSLRVRPVSLIPGMLPPGVPQILINRESLAHCRFDIELLGNCDDIISQLCRNLGPDFSELAAKVELQEIDKLPRAGGVEPDIGEPTSENDIQALKACWEPKVNENISERLPDNSYLSWRPRQYVFHGAEVLFDPDEDEDDEDGNDDDDSSGSESDSSTSSDEQRENGTDVTIPKTDSRIITTLPENIEKLEQEAQQEVPQTVKLQNQDKSSN